jgi:hypothetical protein
MIKSVMNRANEVITWLGGRVCVPIAWRKRLSTTTTRTKQVVISRMAGARLSTVNRSITCRAELRPSGLAHCSGPPARPAGTWSDAGRFGSSPP